MSNSVGTVNSLQGESTITRGGVSVAVTEEMPLYEEDIMKTGGRSSVEIRFIDGAVLVLGDNSSMDLREVSYISGSEKGSFDISIESGMFRFESGEVAELDQGKVLIRTPAAVIGVRGTALVGIVNSAGSTVTLLDDAEGKVGALELFNEFGSLVLSRFGQTTKVSDYDSAMEMPYLMTQGSIDRQYHNVLFTEGSWEQKSSLDGVLDGPSTMFDIHPTYAIIPVSSPIDATFDFVEKLTVFHTEGSSRSPAPPPVEPDEEPDPPVEPDEEPDPPVVPDEPKIFIERDISGTEDDFIDLTSLVNLGPSPSSIRIAGVPEGASFSHGTDNSDGSWSFTASELTDLSIILPENSDETFILRVDKTVTQADMNAAQTIVDAGLIRLVEIDAAILFVTGESRLVDGKFNVRQYGKTENVDIIQLELIPEHYDILKAESEKPYIEFFYDHINHKITGGIEGSVVMNHDEMIDYVNIYEAKLLIESTQEIHDRINTAQAIIDISAIDGINITVSIEAIADEPTISNFQFYGLAGEPIVLDFGILSGDTDGSETLSIELSNIVHDGVSQTDFDTAQAIVNADEIYDAAIISLESFFDDSNNKYSIRLHSFNNPDTDQISLKPYSVFGFRFFDL